MWVSFKPWYIKSKFPTFLTDSYTRDAERGKENRGQRSLLIIEIIWCHLDLSFSNIWNFNTVKTWRLSSFVDEWPSVSQWHSSYARDVNPPCSWGEQTLGKTSRRTRPELSRTWSRRWASWLTGNVYAGQASCPNPRTPGRCSVLPWLQGQRSHHLVGTHWIAERERREGKISLCSL